MLLCVALFSQKYCHVYGVTIGRICIDEFLATEWRCIVIPVRYELDVYLLRRRKTASVV
jgi:hypothetical protein